MISNRYFILGCTISALITTIIVFLPRHIEGFQVKGNFSAFGYNWLCYGHANLTCIIADPPQDYLDGGVGGNTTFNGISYSCDVFGVHLWCNRV